MYLYDVIVIGGGPAGLMAAISAKNLGAKKVCVFEREDRLGGMLNEHIHNGFGIKTFGQELTGPEYIERMIETLVKNNIEYRVGTTVLTLNNDKEITYVNEDEGLIKVKAKAIILAMGCREKTVGSFNIPRNKCAGVYTCGIAHKFMNLEGFLVGKEVVIFGSSNLAMLTARRLRIEGANVKTVLDRNIKPLGEEKYYKECLEDFKIPFKGGNYIVNIRGKERVEGVTVVPIDEDRAHLENAGEVINCDTLLIDVKLLPETSLIKNTNIELKGMLQGPVVDNNMNTKVRGIFACGNLLNVRYNTDSIVEEARIAGKFAAEVAMLSEDFI
ncbi:NAD(P)/FAD-dependent oxidoreductase [Haloimpatiens sp. FM7315]|uniref:NAD(P)/FAD-dependent oxidoreductase n=1 Tax=Haloimpatiens sp. FM7315 TaxID=3298609 RepID=UPI00370BCB43